MPHSFSKWMLASLGLPAPGRRKHDQGSASAGREPQDRTNGRSGLPQHICGRDGRGRPLNHLHGDRVSNPASRSHESDVDDYDRIAEMDALFRDVEFRDSPSRLEAGGYDDPIHEWRPEYFMRPGRGDDHFMFFPSLHFNSTPPRTAAQMPPLDGPPPSPPTIPSTEIRRPRRRPRRPRRAVDCDTDCSCPVSESEFDTESVTMERANKALKEKRKKERRLWGLGRWLRT